MQTDYLLRKKNTINVNFFQENVRNLYKLRDYYFENHSIEESCNKTKVIETELKKTIELFNKHKGINAYFLTS